MSHLEQLETQALARLNEKGFSLRFEDATIDYSKTYNRFVSAFYLYWTLDEPVLRADNDVVDDVAVGVYIKEYMTDAQKESLVNDFRNKYGS